VGVTRVVPLAGAPAGRGGAAVRRRAGAAWVLAAMLWHVLHLALAVACTMPGAARPAEARSGARAATPHAHHHGARGGSGAVTGVPPGRMAHAAEPARAGDPTPRGGVAHERTHGDGMQHDGAPGALACAAAATCAGVVGAPVEVAALGAPAGDPARARLDVVIDGPARAAPAPEPPPPKG
jgi:hypothetical protein